SNEEEPLMATNDQVGGFFQQMNGGGANPPAGGPDWWEVIRRIIEPQGAAETAGVMAAGSIPGVGEAMDVADFFAGIQDRDAGRAGMAALGAALPFVSAKQLSLLKDVAPNLL